MSAPNPSALQSLPVGWIGDPSTIFGARASFERGDEVELAQALFAAINSFGRDQVVCDNGDLFSYNPASGLWEDLPETFLGQIVARFAGAPCRPPGRHGDRPPLRINATTIRGTIKCAKTLYGRPGFFSKATRGIAFADRFVQVTAEGLLDLSHAPEHRARFGYPFALPDCSDAPLYEQFFDDVFRDDPDRNLKVMALEELHGAAITGIGTEYERAALLLGHGANGKSRYQRILKGSMPDGTVTGIAPHLWGDQFARPLLSKSMLNVVAELPGAALIASEAVKAVISGDELAARIPGSAPFRLIPRAVHVFAANPTELPAVSDKSEGFWRRWLVIPFNRSFQNDPKRDPEVAGRILAAELPNVVRRALLGAVRLLKQRDYTLPPSHELHLDAWRRRQDPVGVWAKVCARPARNNEPWPTSTELYASFCVWIHALGFEPISQTAFGRRMGELFRRSDADARRYPVRLREAADRRSETQD